MRAARRPALAAALALCALAGAARADVLVSNVGQPLDGPTSLAFKDVGQAFRTGSNAQGYVLRSIEVGVHTFPAISDPAFLKVSLWSAVGSAPDTRLYVLTGPASIPTAGGMTRFTAPRGAELDPGTKYVVVVQWTVANHPPSLEETVGDGQMSPAEAGWTIDNHRVEDPDGVIDWSTNTRALRIRVNGAAKVPGELWRGRLTPAAYVEGQESFTGYHEDHGGALDDDAFDYGPLEVRFLSLATGNGDLYMALRFDGRSTIHPARAWPVLRLHAGGKELPFSELVSTAEGDVPSAFGAYVWRNVGFAFSAGTDAEVAVGTLGPGVPGGFEVAGGETEAALAWTAADEQAGGPVTGYRHRHRARGSPWSEWTEVSARTTRTKVRGLLVPGRYEFELEALNGHGNGAPATAAAAVTAPPAPALRSDQPCDRARWCKTLHLISREDANGDVVTGSEEAALTEYRYRGERYLVGQVFRRKTTGEDYFLFQTWPALPSDEQELVLDVGGRRLLFRESTEGVDVWPTYRWSSPDGPVVPWSHGDVVTVRLFAPMGVLPDDELVPDGLVSGDRFRLLAVTQGHVGEVVDGRLADGTSVDAEFYNRVVRSRMASGSHPGNPLGRHAGQFTALVSTPYVDARDNTGTMTRAATLDGSNQVVEEGYGGVPVYWVNGREWSAPGVDDDTAKAKVADDYADLLDGAWDDAANPKDEWGDDPCTAPPCEVRPATGSLADGTVDATGSLGMAAVRTGALNAEGGPVHAPGSLASQWDNPRLYALSPVLHVAGAPVVSEVAATQDRVGEVEVTWRADPNGAGLSSVEVEELDPATNQRRKSGNLGPRARSHVFEGITDTGARTYTVRAANAVGSHTGPVASGAALVVRHRRVDLPPPKVDEHRVDLPPPKVDEHRVEPPPLTAALVAESLRDLSHGGEGTTFELQVRFSEAIDPADADCAALKVGNGACASVAAADDAGELWTIAVAPAGKGDVTVELHASDGCAAAGSVCTPDGRPLSQSLLALFTRAVLRAEWVRETVPGSHGGQDAVFVVEARFSEAVAVSFRTLRDDALRVANGDCQKFRRIGRRSDHWEVHVVPFSDAAVTLTLPATADCKADDAVCTGDGVPLSEGITLTVPGPT